MPADDSILLPLGTIATEFEMTRDVLRRILAEAGVAPAGKRGGHPIYRIRDVYRAIQRQSEPGEMTPHARYSLARAIKTEDEIRLLRRELLETVEVERAMGRLAMIAAQSFDTAIDGLERDVGLTPKQAVYLEEHFAQCREALAEEWVSDDDSEI